MWQAAIPQFSWLDVSAVDHHALRRSGHLPYIINVCICVHSNAPIQVPWAWLFGPFIETAAAVMADKMTTCHGTHSASYDCTIHRLRHSEPSWLCGLTGCPWQWIAARSFDYMGFCLIEKHPAHFNNDLTGPDSDLSYNLGHVPMAFGKRLVVWP